MLHAAGQRPCDTPVGRVAGLRTWCIWSTSRWRSRPILSRTCSARPRGEGSRSSGRSSARGQQQGEHPQQATPPPLPAQTSQPVPCQPHTACWVERTSQLQFAPHAPPTQCHSAPRLPPTSSTTSPSSSCTSRRTSSNWASVAASRPCSDPTVADSAATPWCSEATLALARLCTCGARQEGKGVCGRGHTAAQLR